MQVVVLAAGLGSRLGEMTAALPKALVQVAGTSLLLHALRFARLLSPSRIVVVGGFEFAQVKRELEAEGFPPPALTLAQNPDFRAGNILSLLAARPYVSGDLLLMNVDHIYRPTLAPVVGSPCAEITACIDTDRALGNDDMKVERDAAGRVRDIAKTLSRFDCGYVGMTLIPAKEQQRYFSEAEAALRDDGKQIHVERILARLARTDRPPACRDISGHGWLEVDTPDERSRAEESLRDPTWW